MPLQLEQGKKYNPLHYPDMYTYGEKHEIQTIVYSDHHPYPVPGSRMCG
jgi:hypothetical protein